jgi:hypothetical protein
MLRDVSGALGSIDRLAARAEALAGAWGARARNSTTLGRERAVLRLFGVHGLDRDGRPLAWSVVGRHLGGSPARLAEGIALPFAMALLEYDLGPQQLALDIASGAVDLTLEAELLREPDRRAVAEAEASRLGGAALDRIDANRIARRELLDVLGDAPRPWVGLPVREPTAAAAFGEVGDLVRAGADLVRVEVPVGQELAERLERAGIEPTRWVPPDSALRIASGGGDEEIAPTGSQRGVADLRHVLDEAAAERHRYVRLGTAAPGLWAPEQAVVAAFERVDLVEADPIAEIIDGVDPARALADHALARALLRRAGTLLLLGAGPLAVAPDVSRGEPSDTTTRAGRALGLQALAVALARDDGLTGDQVLVGAIPPWLLDERDGAIHALAGVAIREALFAGHPFAYEEPNRSAGSSAAWPFLVSASMPGSDAALIVRRPGPRGSDGEAETVRAAASSAAAVTRAHVGRALTDEAAELARGVVAAAIATLDGIADDGWPSILGEPVGGGERGRLGRDGVAERTESFDPVAAVGVRIA